MMASGAVATLTAIAAIVGAVKQYYRELDQNTANAAQSYAQANSGIESQISEITRLKTALNEGSLSEQEAYNAKCQLYDIQKNLASSYGEQAQGIDLVNGKLEEQTSLIRKNIQAKDASRYLNENDKGIDRAIKKMEQEDRYRLGEIDYQSVDEKQRAALQKIIDKYDGAIQTMMWDSFSGQETIDFVGNAEEANEVINSFMSDIRSLKSEFGDAGFIDSLLGSSSNSLKASSDILSRYKTQYDEYKQAEMFADKNLYGDGENKKSAADWLMDATEAVEKYNDALASGDASKIDEAGRAFYAIKSNIDNLLETSGMGQHSSLFNDIFDQVNKRVESQYKLEEDLATGSAKKHAEILKASGLTALDLKQAFDTEGLQDGETQLNAIIDLADKLGYISKDSAEDVYRLIDSLAEWGYVAGGSTSGVAKSVSTLQTSVKSAIETQNNLTAALAAGNSATGMTSEQMQNVISAFKDIKDFDMATLFEDTATGIQMNTEAFKKYNKQIQLKEQAEMLDAIAEKTREYNDAVEANNTEKISSSLKELAQLQAMLDEYNASISKYNAYITATSSANARDNYGNVVAGYKSVGKLIKQGWTTDDSVTSFMELVRGENWNKGTNWKGEEVILSTAEAYGKLSEKIKGTTHSLKDYLTTDAKGNITSRGAWRFADDLVKIFGGDGSGIASKDANGLYELNLTGDNLQTVADRLGTTTEMVELFGKALSEAGMNVHFEPIANQIKNLEKQAKDLKEQIASSTDDEETTKLMSELNEVNNKTIKKKIIAQVEGGQSVSDLLAMDDKTLSATLDIDVGDAEKAREIIEDIGKSSGEVPINVKIDEGQLQAILGSLTGTVEVTPEVSEQPEFKDASVDVTPNVVEQPKFSPQSVNVSGFPGTSGKFGSSTPGNVSVSGKLNLKLGSYPKTVPSISGTVNYKGNFPTSAPTIYGKAIYTATVQNPPSGGTITVSTGTMTSVAHADGTAYNVLNYKRLSPSHAGGKVALERNEYALTNEVGRESIVRNGVWYMLPPGPHMEHLKKGDIVFSAKQTADLLNAGKTSTYARALSTGTIAALSNGTTGIARAYSGYSGSGYNPWASSGGGYKGSSADTIGSGSSSGGGSNTSSKDDENKIDWIEVAIKRFEALLKKLASIAENTFNNLTTRLEATTENLVSTSKDIDLQGKAYDRYINEANSVGLDAGIAEKVRNGEIDINSYNEDTRKKIEEYKKWYEKADDCATAIEELKTQLGELYKNKFDYIQKDYEDRLDLMQEQAIKFDKELQRLEAQGYKADAAIYESQVNDRTQRINVMKSQLTDMQKAFDDLNASGFLQEGSEAWYEMMLEIQKVKNEIDDTGIEIIQLNNTIRQLKWDSFDSALSLISDLNDEADFLIDLLEDGKMTDDAGNLTEDAMAVLGMHAQKMDTFIGKSQRYAEEIARLDKEISKDPLNNTLIERRKELLKLQRESILAANDEKAAMKDLVSEGIDAQLEAVKKLIDAYSDSLDSAKDLYDYQKKIAEKSDAVSEIEKQLAAYQGDTSQETRATIQKLQEDLKKANEDLQDTEYDRYVSDTKKLLDEFYTDYEDVLNSKLDDVDALVEELIGAVNSNAEIILNTIREATDQVGIGISDEITGIWGGDSPDWGTISSNSDLITEKMSSVLEAVNAIYRNTCLMSGESATMSFASGGLVDYTGKANVHGTKSKPELMLNAGDTKNFLELRDILRKMPQIDLSMRTSAMKVDTSVPEIASMLNAAGNEGYTFGDINIEIDHVENYDDFVSQLQRDKKFEGMIQAMTVGRLSGKSPLDKYSYSWKN